MSDGNQNKISCIVLKFCRVAVSVKLKSKKMSNSEKVDPQDLTTVCRTMTVKSFKTYEKTWRQFLQFANITMEKPPQEHDFTNFFEMKRNGNRSGNTMKTYYSHLNRCFKQLYNVPRGLGVSLDCIFFILLLK